MQTVSREEEKRHTKAVKVNENSCPGTSEPSVGMPHVPDVVWGRILRHVPIATLWSTCRPVSSTFREEVETIVRKTFCEGRKCVFDFFEDYMKLEDPSAQWKYQGLTKDGVWARFNIPFIREITKTKAYPPVLSEFSDHLMEYIQDIMACPDQLPMLPNSPTMPESGFRRTIEEIWDRLEPYLEVFGPSAFKDRPYLLDEVFPAREYQNRRPKAPADKVTEYCVILVDWKALFNAVCDVEEALFRTRIIPLVPNETAVVRLREVTHFPFSSRRNYSVPFTVEYEMTKEDAVEAWQDVCAFEAYVVF